MNNARMLIALRAKKHGWSPIVEDEDGVIYVKGDQRVVIKYKMFGAVVNYMCKFYGKSPNSGINWGIEHAYFGDTKVVGKNKKQQVLTYLRTH